MILMGEFYHLKIIKIKPKIGKLVMFENVFSNLQVNKSVIHESTVITKGVKIVLVIFISINKN